MKYEANYPGSDYAPSAVRLKQYARTRMREGYPGGLSAVLRMTLLFLLLTDWISLLLNLLPTNPMERLADQMTAAMSTGSPDALNGVFSGAPALFQPAAARITLFAVILAALCSLVIGYGYSSWAMALHRGGQPGWTHFFSRFHMAGKIILLSLLIAVCVYLWSLLLLIPGIIALFRYAMSRYILLDQPELSAFTAWNRSKRMMYGHKWSLFLLKLSFLPWMLGSIAATYAVSYLLSMAGLPQLVISLAAQAVTTAFYVYLTPYIELSTVGFYELLKARQARL